MQLLARPAINDVFPVDQVVELPQTDSNHVARRIDHIVVTLPIGDLRQFSHNGQILRAGPAIQSSDEEGETEND